MGPHGERSLHGRGYGRRAASRVWRMLGAGLLLAGCGGGSGSSPSTPPGTGAGVHAELLFVVQAAGASIGAPDAGQRPILHLTGVSPSLLAFADRPLRIASARPTSSLVDGWSGYGFAADPPNGALSLGSGNLAEPLALELREPRYDADAATLDFAVTSLLPDPAAALRARLANDGGCSVALFIDATQPAASSAPPAAQDVATLVDALSSMTGRSFTAEQQDLISTALENLLQLTARDSSTNDPQLIRSNVELFLDDLQQTLGVIFDSDQQRVLTRALMQMMGATS